MKANAGGKSLKQCDASGVNGPVSSRFSKLGLWVVCASLIAPALSRADVPPPPIPDVLVYTDGDRVQGRLLKREGDTWVFRSVRFGDLRVPVADANVIQAESVTTIPPKKPKEKPQTTPVASAASSPYQLARMFHDFFGPWTGRFAFSTQVVSDASERADVVTELLLEREWTKDKISLTARYDYSKTNDIDTTDTFRGSGSWRHTLPKRLFTVYRPSYEWNRASTIDGVNSDYILLQQEVGIGVKAIDREAWKVRVGVAENFFNNWDLTTETHRSARVESVFLEADLKLPWRITMKERAVYFYSFANQYDGWEHQFEVTKKLTDTLSLGLRQELRYNDPDIRTEDYSMVRFMIGLDF